MPSLAPAPAAVRPLAVVDDRVLIAAVVAPAVAVVPHRGGAVGEAVAVDAIDRAVPIIGAVIGVCVILPLTQLIVTTRSVELVELQALAKDFVFPLLLFCGHVHSFARRYAAPLTAAL